MNIYDKDDDGIADVAIYLPNAAANAIGAPGSDNNIIVVDRVTKIAVDGESKYKLYGLNKGGEAQYPDISAQSIISLMQGDVIKPSFDSKGILTGHTYKYNPNDAVYRSSDTSDQYTAEGVVTYRSGTVIKMVCGNGSEEVYNLPASVYVYIIDKANGRVYVSSIDNIVVGDVILLDAKDFKARAIAVIK